MADEILTMAELDSVAGGTVTEMNELYDAMLDNKALRAVMSAYSHIPGVNEFVKNDMISILDESLGIKANIDLGFWNTGIKSKPNTYTDKATGASLSHSEVIGRIKNYFG